MDGEKGTQNVIILTKDQGIFGYDTTSPFFVNPSKSKNWFAQMGAKMRFMLALFGRISKALVC